MKIELNTRNFIILLAIFLFMMGVTLAVVMSGPSRLPTEQMLILPGVIGVICAVIAVSKNKSR